MSKDVPLSLSRHSTYLGEQSGLEEQESVANVV